MPGASGARIGPPRGGETGHPGSGVACYVLSLDRSPARFAAAEAALGAAGLDPVRVPGVDGATLGEGERALVDPRASLRLTGRTLSAGEVGCYLGHVRALRRMLEDGTPHALICEDDVRPEPDLGVLCTALSARGGDWHFANLSNPARRLFTPAGRVEAGGRSFAVQRAHYPPMNAWAVLWTRTGAEAMLRDFSRPFEPWDHAVRRFAQRTDGALALEPAPVLPPEAASEIDARGTRTHRTLRYRWRKWRRLSQQKRQARALMRAAAGA